MTNKILRALKESYWRAWYSYVSNKDKDQDITFMNYGYNDTVPSKRHLDICDEKNRYSIQMYDLVASAIPGALKDKDVLEVGCGRGGGAAFLAKYHLPRSLKAIDLCEPAIDFCKKNHTKNERLSFQLGDAQCIPFAENSFDAVVNIESSHRYPEMPRFLSEVKRVLKKQGYFSFVDFRASNKISKLREEMAASGLSIKEERDITSQVLHALSLDNQRKLDLIERMVPVILRKPAREFASVMGSASYGSLALGERGYYRFLLKKK